MPRPLEPQDHRTTRQDAARYARRYRQQAEHERPLPAIAFHRDAFDRILRQPGCVGIRAYPGLTDAGEPTLVLVGVDDAGNDMVEGALAQYGSVCPPHCSAPNDLNEI